MNRRDRNRDTYFRQVGDITEFRPYGPIRAGYILNDPKQRGMLHSLIRIRAFFVAGWGLGFTALVLGLPEVTQAAEVRLVASLVYVAILFAIVAWWEWRLRRVTIGMPRAPAQTWPMLNEKGGNPPKYVLAIVIISGGSSLVVLVLGLNTLDRSQIAMLTEIAVVSMGYYLWLRRGRRG